MTNVKYDSIEDYNCCYTVGDYKAMISAGISPEEALAELAPRSRDNARTPYQWNSESNAGFTTGKPWIKVNPRYTEINLERDLKSEDSIFAYYRKLIDMRKDCPAIVEGDLKFYLEDSESILAYTRSCEAQTLLIIANKSENIVKFTLPVELRAKGARRLLTNIADTSPSIIEERAMMPYEVEVYELAAN